MKKVFIYVGHSNWGKSRTLKILTDNNSHQKTIQINQHLVRVRKMSNDDDGNGLLEWVKEIPRLNYDRFVIAFCPKVAQPAATTMTKQEQNALDILIELQKTNKLYFFIQKEKFNSPIDLITTQEINWLNTMGTVQVLNGQNIDTTRHQEFFNFIIAHI